MLNGGPVSWCSKRQTTVALSSTEAEYVALTLASKEATWLRLLLTEIGLLHPAHQYAEFMVAEGSTGASEIKSSLRDQEEELKRIVSKDHESNCVNTSVEPLIQASTDTSISLKGDNQGSIALAHNPVYHARTKHIDIQHHCIRDELTAGRINLQYIPTSEMVADGLTKALTHAKFHTFVKQMNMD